MSQLHSLFQFPANVQPGRWQVMTPVIRCLQTHVGELNGVSVLWFHSGSVPSVSDLWSERTNGRSLYVYLSAFQMNKICCSKNENSLCTKSVISSFGLARDETSKVLRVLLQHKLSLDLLLEDKDEVIFSRFYGSWSFDPKLRGCLSWENLHLFLPWAPGLSFILKCILCQTLCWLNCTDQINVIILNWGCDD